MNDQPERSPSAPRTPPPPDKRDKFQLALDEANVTKIYANGFAIGVTNADMILLLQLSARPIAQVNLSYTLAKTLHVKLGQVVADFEARTGRTMLRTDEVDTALAERK